MSDPSTLPEILAALEAGAREIETYFLALPREAFFDGDDARWSPAHHLSHLTLGHKRVARAFGTPAALAPNASGRSRTFARIREAYVTELPRVPAERLVNNPLPPRLDADAPQAQVVADYVAASARLREAAGTWSEVECEQRAVPHPFLGLLSAREMLFFFIVHDRHHLDGVRGRLEGAG